MPSKNTLRNLLFVSALTAPFLVGIPTIANAGECSRRYDPQYVRMNNGGVYRNNWKAGNFLQLNGWNDVARFGVSVQYAQSHTCGCTQYGGNPLRHRNGNATCNRALDSGLR